MKGMDVYSSSTVKSRSAVKQSIGLSIGGDDTLEKIRTKLQSMFQLPPPNKYQRSLLDEILGLTFPVDYCDNEAQVEVLRHHYLNEFGGHEGEGEMLKDYGEDSIIHKVIDNVPSTYRGRTGAVHAWQDLNSYLQVPCQFNLTHISVCQNHAQVNWKAECSEPEHAVLYGTDSFTFDDSNHIKMQTTVALSDKDNA